MINFRLGEAVNYAPLSRDGSLAVTLFQFVDPVACDFYLFLDDRNPFRKAVMLPNLVRESAYPFIGYSLADF